MVGRTDGTILPTTKASNQGFNSSAAVDLGSEGHWSKEYHLGNRSRTQISTLSKGEKTSQKKFHFFLRTRLGRAVTSQPGLATRHLTEELWGCRDSDKILVKIIPLTDQL